MLALVNQEHLKQHLSKTSNANEIKKSAKLCIRYKIFGLTQWILPQTLPLNWHTFHVLQEDFFRCTWCYWQTGPWFEHGGSAAWQQSLGFWKEHHSCLTVCLHCLAQRWEPAFLPLCQQHARVSGCQPLNSAKTSLYRSPHIRGVDGLGFWGFICFSLDQHLIPPRHAVPRVNVRIEIWWWLI